VPTIQVAGRAVDYVLEGEGELIVLSSPTWWPLDAWRISGIPHLRDWLQVLAFNHRGIGGSEATDTVYTIPSLAQDLHDLMDVLGLERCHIIGFANGSGVALAAAALQPGRVRSLVIAAIGAGNALQDGKRVPPPGLLAGLREQGHEAYIRHHALDDFAFSPRSRQAYPERAHALADALWAQAGTEQELIKHAMARQGFDPFERLEQIAQPVLVMAGAEDHVARGKATPAETARALAQRIKGAELEIFPEVRHMLFWEEPDACWARGNQFLARIASTAG
jgi:pimeloyl-ACP methyl ester carboxylesterase